MCNDGALVYAGIIEGTVVYAGVIEDPFATTNPGEHTAYQSIG